MKKVGGKGNQSGFTMVELLASIVIMGLLVAVAIGAISYILKQAEKRYYQSLEKTVLLAGQSYYADHRSLVPKAIGASKKVTLKTLVQNKYLDRVVDYSKKDCVKYDGSYIKVYKYAKDKYNYTLYLNCPNYKITEKTYENELNVNYVFMYNSKNIEDAYVTATMTTGAKSKLASYTYTIYQDGKNVYTSKNIAADGVSTLSKKIKLKKYVPGNIQIEVIVYDTRGNHKLVLSEKKAIYDDSVPKCGTSFPTHTSWSNTSNGKRKVTVNCVKDGADCLQKSFAKTFTEDTDIGYITIKGKNADGTGRGERNCPVNVKLDKTGPVCGSNNGSTAWTNRDRTVTVECKDATSGCSQSSFSKTFTSTTKTANITIKDKAGNTTDCPVNVYVDKKAPTYQVLPRWTTPGYVRCIAIPVDDYDSGYDYLHAEWGIAGYNSTSSTEHRGGIPHGDENICWWRWGGAHWYRFTLCDIAGNCVSFNGNA